VILLDANLLLYAANRDAPEHEAARTWLDEQLNNAARVGFPWPTMVAFVRLAINPLVVRHPVEAREAWRQVRDWLSCPNAWTPVPTERHAVIVGSFFDMPAMTSRLVPDAHLAALAIENGVVLCSTDGDFAKFPGLTWENPLGALGRVTNAPRVTTNDRPA
jgi:toxin-antitoxin system PIN domain toxin